MNKLSNEDVLEVLELFQFNDTEELWWRFDGGQIRMFVHCSDTFMWGTADLEEIFVQDIPHLRAIKEESKTWPKRGKINQQKFWSMDIFWSNVWVARKRGGLVPIWKEIHEDDKAIFKKEL